LEGEIIGPDLPSSKLEYFSGRGGLLSCRTIGCIGLWGGGIHFIGVEFIDEGEAHYGYIEIDIPISELPVGQVLAFAYETEPNKAILAGAIPEPSSTLLLSFGALVAFRRKRNFAAIQ